MQEIRDKVLAILAPNFDSKQLQMIDMAMSKVLSDYHMEKAETLPQIYHPNQWSEIAEYLGRKKSRGLQAGTIYQYKYVLTIFAQYVQKPLPNVEESDIRRFLDELYDILGVPLVLNPVPYPTLPESQLPVILPLPLYDVTTNAKLSAVSNE